MNVRAVSIGILLLVNLAFVAGCGGKSSSSDTATTTTPVYKVEYIPGTGTNAPVQGKTAFQLKISKQSDGSPATGLNPSLAMTMTMSSGNAHGTPVDSVKESATPGTYDCTAYYLMGGTWGMTVMVNGETTTFNPVVSMAMGSDTVRATLYGADDIVSGMSGTSYNKYYLFRDGPISAATPTLTLYISHGENMMMDFQAASMGSVLSSPTGTVTSMIVTASTDSTFPATSGVTVIGADKGDGHWELSGPSSLSSAGAYTVYVKLQINGQDKTADGKTASGTNAYATFSVTSGM